MCAIEPLIRCQVKYGNRANKAQQTTAQVTHQYRTERIAAALSALSFSPRSHADWDQGLAAGEMQAPYPVTPDAIM